MTWFDSFRGESGFEITLKYSQNGETFVFVTASDQVEYVFGSEYGRQTESDVVACLQRSAFQVSVVALFPDGSRAPAGGAAAVIECGRR